MHDSTRDLLRALRGIHPVPPMRTRRFFYPGPPSEEARVRASVAEWLTLYLYEHGPTSADTVVTLAMREGIPAESLAKACEDMDLLLDLPESVRKLIAEADDEP